MKEATKEQEKLFKICIFVILCITLFIVGFRLIRTLAIKKAVTAQIKTLELISSEKHEKILDENNEMEKEESKEEN